MQGRYVRALVAIAGIALGVAAYNVQIDNLGRGTTHVRAAAGVIAGWSFLLAGIAAWSRRPGNRLGPLMVATCFALLARQLRYSHDALAFTTFFAVGEVGYALIAHTALAYPSGRLTDRLERIFIEVTYVIVLAFPLAILLVHGSGDQLRYFDPFPRESILSVSAQPGAQSFLEDAYAAIGYGLLAGGFIALALRKLWRATPHARRILSPLLIGVIFAALWAVYNSVVEFVSPAPDFVVHNVFWWQIAALTALPIALFVGLIRSRLSHANVSELVVQLQRTPPRGIRDALTQALGDPTLELYFWLPERGQYADAGGRLATIPNDDPDRSVTPLASDGAPLAVLVHDPSLTEESELLDAACAAARFAIENARLHADLQAQLVMVKKSRARIASAADEERRRIERDLHDGAQQRLVAIALEIKRAQRDQEDPNVDRLLESLADELQVAVEELREIARGIHPGILTQGSLAVALDSLASRAPIPVSVEAEVELLPNEVEAVAYFVVSEALTNIAKHAHASAASVTASVVNENLVIEVRDNGMGGARTDGDGTGLRGLADRVEAHGGRLRVESPPGGGTRIVGEIPCG
jgi:signal transduction histidine kinase